MRAKRRWTAVGTALVLCVLAGSGGSTPAQDAPRSTLEVFDPVTPGPKLYGVSPPSANPAIQEHVVEAGDGVELFVETWLPAPKDGNVPPARVPTVLVMTPYAQRGAVPYDPLDGTHPALLDELVTRGYAVAQHHVRGTGESGGCIEQTAGDQVDDGARVVEYLGRDAPWADGNVGMYGISYDAETQLSVAGRGNPERTKYLKAIVPLASVGGQYEYSFFDGVPYGLANAETVAFYIGVSLAALSALGLPPPQVPGSYEHLLQKPGCQFPQVRATTDRTGDLTYFWQQREYRPGAANIRAATLYVHGLADHNVRPLTSVGFLDQLPSTTPRKAVYGFWDHAMPDLHPAISPELERTDWFPMVLAWFDRYLKGVPTGVESWPAVQVQGSDGRWRAEPGWPDTGGPPGQLALGPDGVLGATQLRGSTVYREESIAGVVPGEAVFETAPLRDRLELTAQPVLDLWVVLSQPDAHVAARLEAIGSDGAVIGGTTGFGLRSARHLDPLVDGRFVQTKGRAPAVGVPLLVPVRFQPLDLVFPAGARVRLTVAGSVDTCSVYSCVGLTVPHSGPSGLVGAVTILHDCAHPSALRFTMPRPDARWLDVRERVEGLRSLGGPAPVLSSDGGGVATAALCSG